VDYREANVGARADVSSDMSDASYDDDEDGDSHGSKGLKRGAEVDVQQQLLGAKKQKKKVRARHAEELHLDECRLAATCSFPAASCCMLVCYVQTAGCLCACQCAPVGASHASFSTAQQTNITMVHTLQQHLWAGQSKWVCTVNHPFLFGCAAG
jgi:hypothetical protein